MMLFLWNAFYLLCISTKESYLSPLIYKIFDQLSENYLVEYLYDDPAIYWSTRYERSPLEFLIRKLQSEKWLLLHFIRPPLTLWIGKLPCGNLLLRSSVITTTTENHNRDITLEKFLISTSSYNTIPETLKVNE